MAGQLCIGFIVAFGPAPASAIDPPPDLARKVAAREAAGAAARLNYSYRQEVELVEYDSRGKPGGQYREIRDVIFSPETGRSEVIVKGPADTLRFLRLTAEDFDDIREVQPFLFTEESLWAYETRYRGTEAIEGKPYYLLAVRPRQVLRGMRYFDGLLWVDPATLGVARTEGQAVPPVYTGGEENIFPRFTTIRRLVDGRHWFPVHTHADDVLPFRSGPRRIRLTIRYADYRRFAADSTIQFGRQP